MSWTREQRNVTIAAYLGWTLDAFDFFLMVFVLKDIAAEFHSSIPSVAFALTLTLAMRLPVRLTRARAIRSEFTAKPV